MPFNTPTFVDRNAISYVNLESIPKQNEALAIANYYASLHPDNIIEPSSLLYKLAVREYNRKLNSSTRPPVPQWYCGFVNPETGELSLELTDAQLRASNGLVANPIPSQLVETQEAEGEYNEDQCLNSGLPGSMPYSECEASQEDETYPTSGIDWFASVSAETEGEEIQGEEGGGGESTGSATFTLTPEQTAIVEAEVQPSQF